ncbi:MAG: pyruvate kinase, partial [Planctomycetes bacterium]|nr:pyruvate kinase [Planctomycetota bacterium]
NLEQVLRNLYFLAGRSAEWNEPNGAVDPDEGVELLRANTEALLGPSDPGRASRIMVTLPSEAADDLELVRSLFRAGMNAARINCAHDGPDAWSRMIDHLRIAATETGRSCKIQMDLAGPKLRSGPLADRPLRLHVGDTLLLHRAIVPGRPAKKHKDGRTERPAEISCTLPEIFDDLRAGDLVRFNDGKIEGVVTVIDTETATIEIRRAKPGGSRLRADKSINFPETPLSLSGLTDKDLRDLDFVARHADIVALSFVNRPDDVRALQQELAKRHASDCGVLLKIETQRGFDHLPRIVLAGMKSHPLGVMIARGDLAVECGWERMAEIQEEILWICEAAHVPVVWATQVLEGLAKNGVASRAEITDAAMAERAECVMLNKGPYVTAAITTLDDILRRMQDHTQKKSARMRRLHVSAIFDDDLRKSPTSKPS